MKDRILGLLFNAYFGLFILLLTALWLYWHNFKKIPIQPIAFPHDIHVSKVGLDCAFCHENVDRSIHAGVPPMEKCMSCHEAAATDRPEVQKLTKFWNDKQPIPWIKVHHLPEHVYFSHKRHIKAGLDCTQCHGEVKVMRTMRQVSSLRMGWCVSCHQENNAPRDCYTCHK